jgi:very-short-patch-repair endonuclease
MGMDVDKSGIVMGTHAKGKRELAHDLRRRMTTAETRLWARLRKNQLAGLHFRRQQVIDGYVADFYCHEAGLVVEVDGPVHAQDREWDAERDRALGKRGLRVLRFANWDVMQRVEWVLGEIQRVVEGTG